MLLISKMIEKQWQYDNLWKQINETQGKLQGLFHDLRLAYDVEFWQGSLSDHDDGTENHWWIIGRETKHEITSGMFPSTMECLKDFEKYVKENLK